MKNNKPVIKSLKRRGTFYTVLAVCLAIAGCASYFTTKIASKTDDLPTEAVTEATTPFTVTIPVTEAEVNRNVTGVPDERYTEETEATTESEPEIVRAASFSLPLGTTVIKDYSAGELVASKTMGDWRVHNGVDFSGTTGDPVHAVNNGIVTKAYDDVLWGTVVEINHGDGMVARYCGLGKGSTLSEGDKVKINDKIGNLGEIPIEEADGVHLHFEIIQNGNAVDPIAAMGKDRSSLS